eukprot:COSAG02_NODE_17181_length_1023_cov_0.975108_2_plen_186_part_01
MATAPARIARRADSPPGIACPAGQYAEDAGSSKCDTCAAGKYRNVQFDDYAADGRACMECEPGKYARGPYSSSASWSASYARFPHEDGDYRDYKLGLYTDDGFVGDSCTTCPVGRFETNAGSSSCDYCAAGKYQEVEYDDKEEDPASCVDCPTGQTSERGSSSCNSDIDLNEKKASASPAARADPT